MSDDTEFRFHDLKYDALDFDSQDPDEPPPAPKVDADDPLIQLALENGIEIVPGKRCPECTEAVGRTTFEGEPAIACLGALVPKQWQTCSWGRLDPANGDRVQAPEPKEQS